MVVIGHSLYGREVGSATVSVLLLRPCTPGHLLMRLTSDADVAAIIALVHAGAVVITEARSFQNANQ